MLEEMDLEGLGPSPGATPQPSTVWSQGTHPQPPPPGRARAGSPDHDGHDLADDEGATNYATSSLKLSAVCNDLSNCLRLVNFVYTNEPGCLICICLHASQA